MLNLSAGRWRKFSFITAFLLAVVAGVARIGASSPAEYSLVFDPGRFSVRSATLDGNAIEYRAYEGIVYVAHPVDTTCQRMNIFVPAGYYGGKSIGGYDAKTAPVFFPNSVGGYMPSQPGSPGTGFDGGPNAALVALSKGYVVAAPGARGRTSQDGSGKYTGKAPAAIVDLKAAVRYLRFNDERIPGDSRKIVSNGTSAGGALSALLAASGNHADFEPYLKAIGAAEAPDDVYAASVYCPITDLEHADMAYEWQFSGVNDFSGGGMKPPPARDGLNGAGRGAMPGGGMPAGAMRGGPMPGNAAQGTMTEAQIQLSALLKAQFPAYVNSLGLRKADGSVLSLDSAGNGSFKDYVKSHLVASAQKALAGGTDLSGLTWLTVANGTVTDIDFERYVRFATRMKVTAAFDAQDLSTGENELFGTESVNARHFTRFGQDHSTVPATLAAPSIVKLMNPMAYIGAPGTSTARFWRIRHGTVDRDTALPVPVILATKLGNAGKAVDFALPWGVRHSGDYDLDELFDWMARVCR
jgi:hypothetical protein